VFALAIPFWTYIIVLISLCMRLIWHILTNIKKVGFLNAVKSEAAVTIIIWIFICGGLPLLLFIPRSGNKLFKDFVLNPIPKSVKVLDSFDGEPEFYPEICLHFKISPDDFRLILSSENWKIDSSYTSARLTCSDSLKNPWDFPFPPPSLGSNVIVYTFVPRENVFERMITNTQMNEVYYRYINGNLP